jgi:hypothetical protein
VHLHRGLPLFLIWYADLDHPSEERKKNAGSRQIPAVTINNLTGGVNSLNVLDVKLTEEAQRRREEDQKLNNRIHDVEKAQRVIYAGLTFVGTIAAGVVAYALRQLL